jgi:ABC-type multidrug transport system ATPase subunit
MSAFIIETDGLSKKFNNAFAVRDVKMEIAPGTIIGFIGPSGSGKTTTVRLMTGIYKPSAASVFVLGQRPRNFSRANT